MSFISKDINYNIGIPIFKVTNNINNIFITYEKPKHITDTYSIYWDHIYHQDDIHVKKNTMIYWDTDKYHLYLLSSKILYEQCITDSQHQLTKNNSEIYIYFTEPGYYYFSSRKNCKNGKKLTIIVE